jgi:TolB-like protein/class 3 adenylate cyclase
MDDRSERRLAAILFTDIVGSTAVTARDESVGMKLRDRHRALVRPLVERHHGRFVEAPGDESLSTFVSALDAVYAALAIQEVVAAEPELQLHIGIHLGETVFRGSEVFGDGVNIAARVCTLSDGSAPYISDEVHHAVQNQANLGFEDLGEHEFKNVPRPVPVYRVTGAAQPPRRIALLRRLGVRHPRRWLIAALVLLALAASSVWIRFVEDPGPIRSLAVLPLENLSEDPEQEYFADGMTEALIGDLAQIGSLRVISRTSIMQYKRQRKPLPEIAKELNVDAIVEGTVLREGDRVRITAQLIDARNDRHLWAERYDRDLSAVLAMQSEVAQAIAREIRVSLTPREQSELATEHRVEPAAYEAYLKGRYFLAQETPAARHQAVEYLEEATRIDPEYAPAWAELSVAYT